MGSYAYLINKKERISCESHKVTGGGESLARIESPKTLGRFLEYCREKELQIECVDESWFNDNIDYETEEPYTDFE